MVILRCNDKRDVERQEVAGRRGEGEERNRRL